MDTAEQDAGVARTSAEKTREIIRKIASIESSLLNANSKPQTELDDAKNQVAVIAVFVRSCDDERLSVSTLRVLLYASFTGRLFKQHNRSLSIKMVLIQMPESNVSDDGLMEPLLPLKALQYCGLHLCSQGNKHCLTDSDGPDNSHNDDAGLAAHQIVPINLLTPGDFVNFLEQSCPPELVCLSCFNCENRTVQVKEVLNKWQKRNPAAFGSFQHVILGVVRTCLTVSEFIADRTRALKASSRDTDDSGVGTSEGFGDGTTGVIGEMVRFVIAIELLISNPRRPVDLKHLEAAVGSHGANARAFTSRMEQAISMMYNYTRVVSIIHSYGSLSQFGAKAVDWTQLSIDDLLLSGGIVDFLDQIADTSVEYRFYAKLGDLAVNTLQMASNVNTDTIWKLWQQLFDCCKQFSLFYSKVRILLPNPSPSALHLIDCRIRILRAFQKLLSFYFSFVFVNPPNKL